MEQEKFYTIKQVAEMLGVHRTTIYDWMNSGRLAFVQVGERRRIPKSALDTFIKAGTPRKAESGPEDQSGSRQRPALVAVAW